MKIFMPCASVAGLGISAVREAAAVVPLIAPLEASTLDPGLSLLRTLAALLKSLAGYKVASQTPPPMASMPPYIASNVPLCAVVLLDMRIAGNTPRW